MARSEAPSTTSGVPSGRKMKRLVPERPRKRYRVRASAISVPRAVETSVATPAMRSEFWSAGSSSGTSNSSRYQRRVNPCQMKLKRASASLNPNRIITAIGRNR